MSLSLHVCPNLPDRIIEVQMPGNGMLALIVGLVHVSELSRESKGRCYHGSITRSLGKEGL
jgi:hypothetical protein